MAICAICGLANPERGELVEYKRVRIGENEILAKAHRGCIEWEEKDRKRFYEAEIVEWPTKSEKPSEILPSNVPSDLPVEAREPKPMPNARAETPKAKSIEELVGLPKLVRRV